MDECLLHKCKNLSSDPWNLRVKKVVTCPITPALGAGRQRVEKQQDHWGLLATSGSLGSVRDLVLRKQRLIEQDAQCPLVSSYVQGH